MSASGRGSGAGPRGSEGQGKGGGSTRQPCQTFGPPGQRVARARPPAPPQRVVAARGEQVMAKPVRPLFLLGLHHRPDQGDGAARPQHIARRGPLGTAVLLRRAGWSAGALVPREGAPSGLPPRPRAAAAGTVTPSVGCLPKIFNQRVF